MKYRDLRDFLAQLEARGELKRVSATVDPRLEMTEVCANLVGDISRSLEQNGEWHLELLDEAKKPVFRIRLMAESFG